MIADRTETAVPRHRVAFGITGDPRDPAAYSGAPASLLSALGECGLDVAVISTEFGPSVQRLLDNVLTVGFLDPAHFRTARRTSGSARLAFRAHKPRLAASREATAIRSALAAYRVRRSQPVTRVIQFGSEYRLPVGTDYVTLDDATILQLRRSYPYEWMSNVPERTLRRMIARQWRIFRGARACCTLSAWAARSAIEDYGISPSRVHVVGAGANRAYRAGKQRLDSTSLPVRGHGLPAQEWWPCRAGVR